MTGLKAVISIGLQELCSRGVGGSFTCDSRGADEVNLTDLFCASSNVLLFASRLLQALLCHCQFLALSAHRRSLVYFRQDSVKCAMVEKLCHMDVGSYFGLPAAALSPSPCKAPASSPRECIVRSLDKDLEQQGQLPPAVKEVRETELMCMHEGSYGNKAGRTTVKAMLSAHCVQLLDFLTCF